MLLDGTMSSLKRGYETNIGLTYRLLSEVGPAANLMVYYEPGIQWRGLKRSVEVIAGIGINRQIKRSYLFLARNYRPGDRIFLMGYSRGAFAVRSLAGLIDKLGLMRPAQITEETMARLYDLYEREPDGASARAFRETRCHPRVEITMVGVYDCVRALGVRWPVLWRLAPQAHKRAVTHWHWRRREMLTRRFCGMFRPSARAISCRCGFAARMAMSAAISVTGTRRGRCRISRWSGCWNAPRRRGWCCRRIGAGAT